jgi:hypothetical protein
MKPLNFVPIVIVFFISVRCNNQVSLKSSDFIAQGQMPSLARDKYDRIHVVYGSGDSVLYSSSDNGNTFSKPTLVAILTGLAASHMRGPQIAAASNGLVAIACTTYGNILSYSSDGEGKWTPGSRVNDIDSTAKENLIALGAEGNNAFAVWLDLRDKHNKIFGARSSDGGKTWSKNIMVYASPDTTVCECCKPSVVIKGQNVYVMFRNWLNGNRDLYLINSSNGGVSFEEAQKLGTGNWPLNGCPMDGGGLALNKNGNPETVWNRKGVIYACEPGKEEKKIGEGRNCTMESVNGKNVYAWVQDGNVIVMKPKGMNKNLGKGQLPALKAVNNEHVLCVWEKDKQIHKAVVEL